MSDIQQPRGQATLGDRSARGGSDRPRRDVLPLLRDQPAGLLHVAAPLPRTGYERSPGPLTPAAPQPRATHVDVVGKICYLRQNYHFGPGEIAMYLKRYHDVEVSRSGVWRILKRLDLNRLPASQRHKRLDKR